MKPKKLRFDVGNYVERGDGAVFVRFDDTLVYFNDSKVIAVVTDGVAYRSMSRDDGINYKRVRAALNGFMTGRRVVMTVTQADLQLHLEAAIMRMATKLVDRKLDAGTTSPVLA